MFALSLCSLTVKVNQLLSKYLELNLDVCCVVYVPETIDVTNHAQFSSRKLSNDGLGCLRCAIADLCACVEGEYTHCAHAYVDVRWLM